MPPDESERPRTTPRHDGADDPWAQLLALGAPERADDDFDLDVRIESWQARGPAGPGGPGGPGRPGRPGGPREPGLPREPGFPREPGEEALITRGTCVGCGGQTFEGCITRGPGCDPSLADCPTDRGCDTGVGCLTRGGATCLAGCRTRAGCITEGITCRVPCELATHHCKTIVNTCFTCIGTCATHCNQNTCAATCATCNTNCNQATCATCATNCNQATCGQATCVPDTMCSPRCG